MATIMSHRLTFVVEISPQHVGCIYLVMESYEATSSYKTSLFAAVSVCFDLLENSSKRISIQFLVPSMVVMNQIVVWIMY